MAGRASRENGKKGGRPKGSKSQSTLDKEALRAHVAQKVAAEMDGLLDAQILNAKGISQFVYRDDHGRFKVIDDPDELKACVSLGKAVRIFTRLPNVVAFTDLLNRTLDKPKEQEQDVKVDGTLVIKWQK